MAEHFDKRNRLNDLTGKEWLISTKSFFKSKKSKIDIDSFNHPAPFLVNDIKKMILFFTKKNMTVLDPFVGSGTTIISAVTEGRKCIGIDLNPKYKQLAELRFKKNNLSIKNYRYIVGDSAIELKNIRNVDFIITSPPYHNILRNKNLGTRKKDKLYRSSKRIGINYYSDDPRDLGNQLTYQKFLNLLTKIMSHCFKSLNENKYCAIVISDFTVNKKEVCSQADVINIMKKIGFEFCGTIILLQDSKPLYPFGYPYTFKINHMHQNIIIFKKNAR